MMNNTMAEYEQVYNFNFFNSSLLLQMIYNQHMWVEILNLCQIIIMQGLLVEGSRDIKIKVNFLFFIFYKLYLFFKQFLFSLRDNNKILEEVEMQE